MARKSAHGGASTPSRTQSSQNTSSSNTPSTSAPIPGVSTNTDTKISASTSSGTTTLTSKTTTTTTTTSSSSSLALQDIIPQLWNGYIESTPQRTKLIDAFMLFLLVVGGVQFVYCVVFGTYPYNAFLSGFGITVGQFVLTASLRIQTNAQNASEFKSVSPERAFADYVLGSLILHFFCVNFIN